MTLALMVVAGIVEVGIFFIGTLTAEFYKVLTANDFEGFLNLCLKCLGLFILSGLFKSLQKLVGGLLQTRIRLTLTLSLQDTYFDQLSLDAAERLRCNEERKSDRLSEDSLMSTSVDFDSRSTLAHEGEFIRFLSLDNPDQRMTQDVDQWAQVWVRFLSSTLLAPFLITYYSYESVMTAGWICPVIIFSYFCLSSTLSLWIASPVARRIYEKEYWEGEYRYEHVRVRNQTEQIVTWKAENTEKVILGRLLRHLIKAQSRVFHWEFWTIWMTTFSAEFGSVVAFIVLGIPIFQGTLNIRIHLVNYLFAFEFIGWLGKYRDVSSFDLASIISKNAFFVMYLLYKFTSLIELSDVLSQLAGYTARISQLLEKQTCLRKLSLFDQSPSMPTIIGLDTLLSLTNYSFYLPSNARVCVEEFDVPALQPSITILSGPSGIGKTSFVRALCGLAPTNMQVPLF
jgi:ATP-binding cassette subfamily D (ALD) protein 4